MLESLIEYLKQNRDDSLALDAAMMKGPDALMEAIDQLHDRAKRQLEDLRNAESEDPTGP